MNTEIKRPATLTVTKDDVCGTKEAWDVLDTHHIETNWIIDEMGPGTWLLDEIVLRFKEKENATLH